MHETVEISKRMRVTSDDEKTHLEIKTVTGWERVSAKRAKTLRSGDWLSRPNKIALCFLCAAIFWAVLVRMKP